MTDKPTPKEIEDLFVEETGFDIDDFPAAIFDFARAVLDKWGTPAPVVVGEVAERYRNAIASACEGWTMPDGLRKHLETALWSQPTQQPTQVQPIAQAAEPVAWLDPWTGTKVTTDYDAYGKHGIPLYTAPQPVAREPLTPERLREIERMCVYANTATLIDFARAIERAHGIKGGQHAE